MSTTTKEKQIFYTQTSKVEFPTTSKNFKNKFTKEEDLLLLQLAEKYKGKQWQKISEYFINKNYIQCFSRYQRIHPEIRRGTWKKDEDEMIIKYYRIYGSKWSKIASELKTRNGKQVRDRFLNMLDPSRNTSQFTEEEDQQILKHYSILGAKWAKIAEIVNTGRNPDMIKNRFYSHLKDKSSLKLKIEEVYSASYLNTSTQISNPDTSNSNSQDIHEMESNEIYGNNTINIRNNSIFNIKEIENIEIAEDREDKEEHDYWKDWFFFNEMEKDNQNSFYCGRESN